MMISGSGPAHEHSSIPNSREAVEGSNPLVGYVKSPEELLPTYSCASHCISLPNDDFHKARRRVYIAVERPSGMVIW